MAYYHPEMVLSPKGVVSDLKVVYNGGEGSWSVAEMKWNKEPSIGIRWNGGSDDPKFPGIGNPQSRGVPTWFILPSEVANVVLEFAIAKNLEKVASNTEE